MSLYLQDLRFSILVCGPPASTSSATRRSSLTTFTMAATPSGETLSRWLPTGWCQVPGLSHHTVVNICAGWMILIQVMATCALITSITAQLVSVSLVLRVPVQVVLRWEVSICTDIQLMIILDLRGDLWQFWWFSTCCLPCSCWSQSRWGHSSHWPEVSLSEQVFPLCCWRRDYLLYPNYNYLSWSYAAGLASILACLSSIGCLYQVTLPHLWHSQTSLSFRNWWKWRTEKRKTCQFSINFIPNWTQVTTLLMPVQ